MLFVLEVQNGPRKPPSAAPILLQPHPNGGSAYLSSAVGCVISTRRDSGAHTSPFRVPIDSAIYLGFAYWAMPVISTITTGSFPTTQASCPGGTTPTSPGPNSCSVPSSILTRKRPEIWKAVWEASQLLVLTIGFTDSDHFHPG